MPNRLSHGCCCGCDLLDVTFGTTPSTWWGLAFGRYNAANVLQSPATNSALGSFAEGERLITKRSLPQSNWAIDLTQLIPATFGDPWLYTPGNALIVSLLDDDSLLPVATLRLYAERSATPDYVAAGFDYYRSMLRCDVTLATAHGVSADLDLVRKFSTLTTLHPIGDVRGFSFLVRDTVLCVAEKYAGGTAAYYHGEIAKYNGRVPLPLTAEFPKTKLQIEIEGTSTELHSLFAGKIINQADEINVDCPDKSTCAVVPPYHHQEWDVGAISTPYSPQVSEVSREYTACCASIHHGLLDQTPSPAILRWDQDLLINTLRCAYANPEHVEFPGPTKTNVNSIAFATSIDELIEIQVCVEDADEDVYGVVYKVSIQATIRTSQPGIGFDPTEATGSADDFTTAVHVQGGFATYAYPSSTVTSHPLYEVPDACPANGNDGGTLKAPGTDVSELRLDRFFLNPAVPNDPLVLNWVLYRPKWTGNGMPDITVTGSQSIQAIAGSDLTRRVFTSTERLSTLPPPPEPDGYDYGYGTWAIGGNFFQTWQLQVKSRVVDYHNLSITLTGP